MGRISSIDKLPEDLRRELIELLRNPAVTQADITAAINAKAGDAVVSRSAVNRYAKRMERMLEKTRRAREMAEAYIEKAGIDNSRNRIGKAVNQQIRVMCLDVIDEVEELKESGEVDPKLVIDLISKVARGLRELEQAEKINADRAREIREEVLQEVAEASKEALAESDDKESAALILRRIILGLQQHED